MAFLDNSGDIILDAVLTDAGRQRMARGDFKIVKFALGDEEVNYEIFNANHPSGSAFFDLSIMQTPVLEAFTNNTSLMKTKLLSLNRNNILFMPKLALNAKSPNSDPFVNLFRSQVATFNGYFVLADKNTVTNGVTNAAPAFSGVGGVIAGTGDGVDGDGNIILIDQGIDGAGDFGLDATFPSDLVETAFMVKVDHRLLRLQGAKQLDGGRTQANFETLNHSFVDDDGIATYYIAAGDPGFHEGVDRHRTASDQGLTTAATYEVFIGPTGNRLAITPLTSNAIKHSNGLFTELGNTNNALVTNTLTNIGDHRYIDTIINVVGVTTGYALDIPIRIVKKS